MNSGTEVGASPKWELIVAWDMRALTALLKRAWQLDFTIYTASAKRYELDK